MSRRREKFPRKIIGAVLLGAILVGFSLPKGVYAEDCTRGGTECMVGSSCPTTRKKVPDCHPTNPSKLQCVAGSSCSDPHLDWKCCAGGDGGGCVDTEPPTCDDLRVFWPYEDRTPENPGFESGLSGWDASSKASAEGQGYEGYGPHSGSLMLTARSGHFEDDKGRASYTAQRTITGLTPGKTYNALVWAQPGHQHGWGSPKCYTRGYVELTVITQTGSEKIGTLSGEYWHDMALSFVPGADGTATIKLKSQKYKKGGWKKGDCWGWGVTGSFDDVAVYYLGPEVGEICPETPSVGLKVSASDDCGVEWMRFSNDEGATWSGWVPYQSGGYPWTMDLGTGTVWAEVKDGADRTSGAMEGCKFRCISGPAIKGSVWREADDNTGHQLGIQDPDEGKSTAATLYLDDYGNPDALISSVDDFTVEVDEGDHTIYVDPDPCFCPSTRDDSYWWNRNADPSAGGPCLDDPWGGVCSYTWDGFSEVWYAEMGDFGSSDIKSAHLGIQKSVFSVELPTGTLIVDPDEVSRRVYVNVEKVNNCWDPLDGVVEIDESDVTITPNDGAISVDSIDLPPSLVPDFEAWINLKVEKRTSYADSYTLCVKGRGNPGCLGEAEDCVELKVEHVGWIQSEAGDVYGASDVTSYIPTEVAVRYFRDEPRFSDLGPPYSFFSLAKISPGVVLSGGIFEWGAGLVSEEGWGVDSYEIGFYDPDEGYDYDFDYFEANLEPSCTLYGSTRMTGGGLAGEDATGTPTNCFVDSHEVIEVNGDLEVQDAVGFDGEKATILVDGNIIFKSDFDPTGFYAFITSRNIEISSVVENIRAFLLADGAIYDYDVGVDDEDDWEDQENGLLISGSAVALDSLDLRRTRKGADGQPDTADDDLEAANYFAFDGELFLELEAILGTPRYTWKEVE